MTWLSLTETETENPHHKKKVIAFASMRKADYLVFAPSWHSSSYWNSFVPEVCIYKSWYKTLDKARVNKE